MKRLFHTFLLLTLLGCESTPEQALVDAVRAEDAATIATLLSQGADPNGDGSSALGEGTTATFEAACTGNMAILDQVIAGGGDPAHVMEFGTLKIRLFSKLSHTIGHQLAECEMDAERAEAYIAIIQKVVAEGADIGVGAQDQANEFNVDNRNAIKPVAANPSMGFDDVDADCLRPMRKILQAYIRLGADIDAADYYNETALIYHVQHRNYQMVEMLIQLGADVNKTGGSMSASPLWYAYYTNDYAYTDADITYDQVLKNDNAITQLLRAKGAKETCGMC